MLMDSEVEAPDETEQSRVVVPILADWERIQAICDWWQQDA